MGDEDEDWNGPIRESSPPVEERVEALEEGRTAPEVIAAEMPVEERIARLERIAEYLHETRIEDARIERLEHAAKYLTEARAEDQRLIASVDRLGASSEALNEALGIVGRQQEQIVRAEARIEEVAVVSTAEVALRVNEQKERAEEFRARITKLVVGPLGLVALALVAVLFYVSEVDRRFHEVCERRNRQVEVLIDVLEPFTDADPAVPQGMAELERLRVDCG